MGQTATGKHELAIKLAEKLDAEIISIDSMKVYRGLDIGTCKPSPDERRLIAHHIVDITTPDRQFDAGRFVELAGEAASSIHSRGKNALFSGGTFLYYKAYVYGFSRGVMSDAKVRARYEKDYSVDPESVFALLQSKDPATAARLHIRDKKRVIRALEYLEITGRPISADRTHFHRAVSGVRAVALTMETSKLRARIAARIHRMVSQGLVEEAARVRDEYDICKEVRSAIGYREAFDVLDGKLDAAALIDSTYTRTCRFARKQMTWIRSLKELEVIDAGGAGVIDSVLKHFLP